MMIFYLSVYSFIYFSGSHDVHGSPLGDEEIAKLKTKLGYFPSPFSCICVCDKFIDFPRFDPAQTFFVPDEVRKVYDRTERGQKDEEEWNAIHAQYQSKFPDSDFDVFFSF